MQDAQSISNVPDFIKEKGFVFDQKKIRMRMNITTKCNLRCDYCSVNAGKTGKNMSKEIAFSAINFFANYAEETKAKKIEIVFSGGEPTTRLPLISEIIKFGQDRIEKYGTELFPRLITNGLFSIKKFHKTLNFFKEIQISWDGFSENPRYKNQNIAIIVWNNIEYLFSRGIPISILIVVSESNYLHLQKIIDSLYKIGVMNIFLGIEENLGRALGKVSESYYDKLDDIYFDIWKQYRILGIDINLTGTDIHSISPFPCSAPIPNFSISPEGIISACTLTFNEKNQFSDFFTIGSVNNHQTVIDSLAITKMRNLHVLNIKECQNCFAKWHCRGGCIYAKRGNWLSPLTAKRCNLIRSIVAKKLAYVINENS